MTLRHSTTLLAVLLTLPAALRAGDKKYQLTMERPLKAGTKWKEQSRITIEQSQLMKMGDRKLKEEAEDIQAELSATLEVLETGPKGNVRKMKLTVEKFSLLEEGKTPARPAAPGDVITCTAAPDGKESYTSGERGITGAAAKVLDELLELDGDNEKPIDDDLVNNTREPRAPGSEWEVNKAALIEAMPADAPLILKPEGVTGKLKFPALKTIQGMECAQVQIAASLKPSGLKGLPPEFEASKLSMQVTGEQMVPLDPAKIVPAEKLKLVMEVDGSFETPQGKVTLHIFSRSDKERTTTPAE